MAEMNDIKPPAQEGGEDKSKAEKSPDKAPVIIKFRITPIVAGLIGGSALCVDLLQNALGLTIIGEFGLNQIIGSLSVLVFYPIIFYLASDQSNPVVVYGFKSKDVYKLGTMVAASLSEVLPLSNELWAITASVTATLSAVYIEDLLNSGISKEMLGKTNRFVRSVGGFVSGRGQEIKKILNS